MTKVIEKESMIENGDAQIEREGSGFIEKLIN